MASYDSRNPSNVPGALFVDTSCIDCGTCFHIAPDIFLEKNNLSVIGKQPVDLSGWAQAKEAILSCPTTSIGVHHAPVEFKNAPLTLPRLITDSIYYCGYTSVNSYGASSYLIRTQSGNILIDSPRFNSQLISEIEKLGGVKWMFLTHKDDVADHRKFKEHFNCVRIIHEDDLEADTKDCEMILKGQSNYELTSELKIIMTPGHTRGHMVLHLKNLYLFTGDHLFFDAETSKIYASKIVNWYSWNEQLQSIQKLIGLNVGWIFPGHGGWFEMEQDKFKSDLEMTLKNNI